MYQQQSIKKLHVITGSKPLQSAAVGRPSLVPQRREPVKQLNALWITMWGHDVNLGFCGSAAMTVVGKVATPSSDDRVVGTFPE